MDAVDVRRAHFRAGCLVRSALAALGVVFLPFAIWFLHADWRANWATALVVGSLSLLSLRFALARDARWLAAIEDLDATDHQSGEG